MERVPPSVPLVPLELELLLELEPELELELELLLEPELELEPSSKFNSTSCAVGGVLAPSQLGFSGSNIGIPGWVGVLHLLFMQSPCVGTL